MWFEIDKQRHRESPLLEQSQTNVEKDATSQLVTKVCSVYTVYLKIYKYITRTMLLSKHHNLSCTAMYYVGTKSSLHKHMGLYIS